MGRWLKGVVNRRWLSGGTPEVYLFLFIPPSPFPRSFYFALCTLAARCGWFFEGGKKKHRDTLQDSRRMDQAGILRKFIQEVKAMSEGDEERGEDNFGSDFMVGPN